MYYAVCICATGPSTSPLPSVTLVSLQTTRSHMFNDSINSARLLAAIKAHLAEIYAEMESSLDGWCGHAKWRAEHRGRGRSARLDVEYSRVGREIARSSITCCPLATPVADRRATNDWNEQWRPLVDVLQSSVSWVTVANNTQWLLTEISQIMISVDHATAPCSEAFRNRDWKDKNIPV